MSDLLSLVDDYHSASSDENVNELVKKYGLVEIPYSGPPRTILGEYTGVVEGRKVELKYRWYDPSGPFNMQPDIHVLKLKIEGFEDIRESKFEN
ncbi:MAG: hypothetical protein ACAH07_06080 [Methylophilaceae bacterium]|nr:hypothetical protein [Methyloradius sp.]